MTKVKLLDKNDTQRIKIANLDNFDLRPYSAMFYPNHEIGHFYPWQIYPCRFYPWIKKLSQRRPNSRRLTLCLLDICHLEVFSMILYTDLCSLDFSPLTF